MAENQEYETWKANGRIVLRKFDRAGGLTEVMVNKGRKIQLTEQERLLNQDRVIEEKMDPFANGTLSPVRLPESSSESSKAIVSSPNTMTEEDMVELLNAHHKTFDKKINEITSPYVMRQMVELAQGDEVDVTLKRVEALESRLREITADEIQVVEHAVVSPKTTGVSGP